MLARQIVRFRWVYFAVIAIFIGLSYSGEWRIGRDSAAYRGLAHHLATTGKYVFREKGIHSAISDQQDTRYPGFPYLLAIVEKVAGPAAWPGLMFMTILGGVTVWLIHRLMLTCLEPWLAVAVTFGVGTNGKFLQHTQELLTDIPFLMAIVVTALGMQWLAKSEMRSRKVWGAAMVGLGLLAAAALRPTFWLFAIALVLASVISFFRSQKRSRWVALLPIAFLALAALVFWMAVDQRTKRGTFSGGYELSAANKLANLASGQAGEWGKRISSCLEEAVPELFFGTQMGGAFHIGTWAIGMSSIATVLVMVGAMLLIRRNALWGIYVLVTFAVVTLLGAVPRYFIAVLPFMLAGWGLLVFRVANFSKWWLGREMMFAAGLAAVVIPNLIQAAELFRQQHGFTRPISDAKKWVVPRKIGFLPNYQSGHWVPIYDVAKMVRRNLPANVDLLGPEATVLTYLSERRVYGLGMMIGRKTRYTQRVEVIKQFKYALFPVDMHTPGLYDDADGVTWRMIRDGVIKPTKIIAQAGGYELAEFEVLEAKKKRRKRHPAPTTQAASQPATQATTLATTQPRRRRRRPATTTAPTTRSATLPASRPVIK